jgi:hypothetical protein
LQRGVGVHPRFRELFVDGNLLSYDLTELPGE